MAGLRTRITFENRGGFPALFALMLVSLVLATGSVTALTQISERTVRQLPASERAALLNQEFDGSRLARQALRLSPYMYKVVSSWVPGSRAKILRPPTEG